MIRRLAATASILITATALAQNAAPTQDAAVPSSGSNGASAAEDARRARVYARAGSRTVTVGDIEDAIAAQTPFQRQRYLDEPARLEALAKLLVDREVLATEAERRKLDEAPAAARAIETNLVQLLTRRTIDAEITPSSFSADEVAAYYAAHSDEFSRPEMVRSSQVLVATEDEARALLERCKSADLATFHQWARDQSLDTETKQSGGDLRYFTRDGRPIETAGRPVAGALVTASFAIAEVGQCADEPVRLENHFSVLMLTGRRPADTTPLSQAETKIRRKLWQTRRDAALTELTSAIRARVPVTRHDELLMRVVVPEPSPETLGQPRHAH